MARLDPKKRAQLPDSAFAYVDSRGRRRLPINDAAHVRNALARFNQVSFESDAARERARKRLLNAARKFGIVPVGFMTGQLEVERRHAAAGRLVIELGRSTAPGELQEQLRSVLRDPALVVLYWSASAGAYVDGAGRPVALPAESDARVVTYLESQGKKQTAIVHDRAVLDDPDLVDTVLAAVRFVVDKERSQGILRATSTEAAALPTGFVTLMMTDIENSTGLLRRLGDRYRELLEDVRAVLRECVARTRGREIDARADEFFAVFENPCDAVDAAIGAQATCLKRTWPDGLDVRVRVGLHSGNPTLTDIGYIGLAVHVAARVCSAGHGGQILVSRETRDAVDSTSPGHCRFRELGRFRLAGLPEPETLYQVEADGLPTDLPPPRAHQTL
jgi:class 3 adenylate cyclase